MNATREAFEKLNGVRLPSISWLTHKEKFNEIEDAEKFKLLYMSIALTECMGRIAELEEALLNILASDYSFARIDNIANEALAKGKDN